MNKRVKNTVRIVNNKVVKAIIDTEPSGIAAKSFTISAIAASDIKTRRFRRI